MSLHINLVDPTATYSGEPLYSCNITHNLSTMANKAGIFEALWKPEEIDAIYAKDIIDIVIKGLKDLKERPEYFSKFNASNGWGIYKHFVPFVEMYLDALKLYPESKLIIDR